VRHALADRLFHWLSAACVLILLATAFLPVLGMRFAWVTIHWMTGLLLIALVLFHAVRALGWQAPRAMLIGKRDLESLLGTARYALRLMDRAPAKPGKYSLAQKLTHHAVTVLVLATLLTGAPMLVRIDSPWWERNPYWLAETLWGWIYVVHGFAALCLITVVMIHVYFALRPEKLFFTRAMIRGWITREEYREHHDPDLWQADR
jgi:cytochrome b subunit of formate dehydrogenase